MSEQSPEARLAHESLLLQTTILPELRDSGVDTVNNSSLEGLGRHAITNEGITISFNGRTWREAELADNASIRIKTSQTNLYRVEIRSGEAEVYDQDEQRVVDRTILEKLTLHVIMTYGTRDIESASFEEEHRKVVQ